MRNFNRAAPAGVAAVAAFCIARFVSAHGFVGNRFFPPTISTDDPFAVDELALPTISYFKNPADDDGPASREIDAGFEFDKEIFPHFAIGISDTHISNQPVGSKWTNGWDNVGVTAKYQLWQNDDHEAVVAIGLDTDIGGTGTHHIGTDSFTTFSPTLYYGKGFGDLPDSVWYLQPLAVTGTLSQSFPTSAAASNAFGWSFALEYSLPYLQQHVRDIGLPHPIKDLIFVVEIPMTTTENRGAGGQTTGTINPGVLYESQYFEIGAEAVIPINRASARNVGAVVQVWIFIDDLLPKVFGHPLFGAES